MLPPYLLAPSYLVFPPLFFVIYVAPLHAPDGIFFRLSYVDGFSLTVASTPYEQNSRKLIAAFDSLTTQGRSILVPFAPEKTEVIHWETHRQRSPAPLSPILLGGQSITPSPSVHWLDFWFDQRRTGTIHFQKEQPAQQLPSDFSAPSHLQPRASPLKMSAILSNLSFAPTSSMAHRSSWKARHPLEARHDPCSRQQYLFSKYLTPSAAYRVTNTIKKEKDHENHPVCFRSAFYLYLGGDN